jgi:putative NADPH-quinone reductase
MRVSIILAHPRPASFNHAIAEAAREALRQAGHTVNFHDLCAEHFDPLLPPGELVRGAVLPPIIQQHCDEIVSADGVIVVHPNWWAQAPAILKGWLDRVLRMGVAYRFGTNEKGEGVPIGLLKAQWALVFTTSNTPQAVDQRLYGDPLEGFWRTCVWGFCGVPHAKRVNYDVIITSTAEQRAAWLGNVRHEVAQLL